MSPDDGAIEDQVLHIRVIGEMLVHLCPYIVVIPARKAFVDAIPVPVFLRQPAPLGSGPGNPQHPFDEAPTLTFLSHIGPRTVFQELEYFLPLIVS